MDPDQAYKDLGELAREIISILDVVEDESPTPDEFVAQSEAESDSNIDVVRLASEMAEKFIALDYWLTHRGFLPKVWQR